MTVGDLKRILSNYPDNAIVTVESNDLYLNGEYEATSVGYTNFTESVCIKTDYERRVL